MSYAERYGTTNAGTDFYRRERDLEEIKRRGKAERQRKRNIAEWRRRIKMHVSRGELDIAANITAHLASGRS